MVDVTEGRFMSYESEGDYLSVESEGKKDEKRLILFLLSNLFWFLEIQGYLLAGGEISAVLWALRRYDFKVGVARGPVRLLRVFG